MSATQPEVPVGEVVGGAYGFIDRQGAAVIAPRFRGAGPFRDGLAHVKEGRQHGFIDRQGRWLIEPRFLDAGDFSQGLAAVQLVPPTS